MKKEEILIKYPQLTGVIGDIKDAGTDTYMYKGTRISELLGRALTNDPEIEDKEDIPMITKTFEWLEYSIIPHLLSDEDWDKFKKEVIRKDPFLETLFKKNKLRRSCFGLLNIWFVTHPSLFCNDKSFEMKWEREYLKTKPDPLLAEKLKLGGEEFKGEPSQYDLYDTETKLSYAYNLTGFIRTVLITYINKHYVM